MNKIILTSVTLTRDPEIKKTADGKSICKFTVAWNDGKKQGHFFDCEAWEKNADNIAQYFTKGKPIEIEGTLLQDSWDDSEGKKHYKLKIRVNSWGFVKQDKTASAEPGEPQEVL